MNYDIIGDIHGHADALKTLLDSMGYRCGGGAWGHPDRQAVFVGDLIDRGPRQVETVDIVRAMVRAEHAHAILGNHEFNAIAWFTPDPAQEGEYLRQRHSPRHGAKNYKQHEAFLSEVAGTPKHKEIIDWFMTLPLWLELDGIRVAHACWHQGFMDYLAPHLADGNRLHESMLVDACREPDDELEKDGPGASHFKAIEAILKGMEVPLPDGHSFQDKEGHTRTRVRTRWWDAAALSFRQAALLDDAHRARLPDTQIPSHMHIGYTARPPLFIGHYWESGRPQVFTDKVACVDYSMGKGVDQGGKLVAYRWDGEQRLDSSKFHWIGA